MTKPGQIASLFAALCLMAAEAMPQGIIHARGGRWNTLDGVTARRGTAFRGINGGAGVRGHSVVTDGQGNATRTSGSAYRGPNGAAAGRKATTTVARDGSATRQSSASASGANGSVQSAANYQRNADGTATASRSTSATANNGNTYQGNRTWTKGAGVQHTGTCKDSSGTVISCPGK